MQVPPLAHLHALAPWQPLSRFQCLRASMIWPSRKFCVSHPQSCQGQETTQPPLVPLLEKSKKHRSKFSVGMGTSQVPLGVPSIAPLWSAAGLGPCYVLYLPRFPARGSPKKASCGCTLRSSVLLPGQVSKCGSKGGRHTHANNVSTWCLHIMDHDAPH